MRRGWQVVKADLSGVLVKIDRARAHLDEFDREASRVEAACRDAIVRERDERRSEYVFRFDRVPAVPAVLSAIAGDAIHNLRVSLDHLAWQLVIATGGTPRAGWGGTTFPIYERSPSPDSRPQINPGVPEGLRQVLDELQPYKRARQPEHHQLAILNRLDISDKHHQLLVAVIGVQSLGWWGEVDPTGFNSGPYRDGSEVCRFPYSGTSGTDQFSPTFVFRVRLDEPAAGPWSRTLGAADLVRRHILRYIENEVLPRFRDYF
jgi:hypothetical protein